MKEAEISFLQSAFKNQGQFKTIQEIRTWVDEQRSAIKVDVEAIQFDKLRKWHFDNVTGNLVHDSGKFFSIEGVEVKTNIGNVPTWTQPIINQPEIGFLGFIAKKFNGVLHFLLQAKIEPGNINYVQLSPTLQATKSNYSRIHQGNAPLYLEYFRGERKVMVLLDQLQSEQGARFLKKRNRNIIVEVFDDIPVYENFCWVTLGQVKELLCYDNLINMDTRTVLSGISYGSYPANGIHLLHNLVHHSETSEYKREMLFSALETANHLYSLEEIISWITSLKSKYELEVEKVPLNSVKHWIKNEKEIFHEQHKYFSVIAVDVHISNREVINWTQPLVKSAQEGLIGFIIKKINGVYHFLVQAKVEAGNFDILELAPTVQCLTGNYRTGLNDYEVPFIKEILEAKPEKIIYKANQSEEGGRFFREQNLNIIVEVEESFSQQVPENYTWMTLNQLYAFIKFNNYLNIQARSLLSAVTF